MIQRVENLATVEPVLARAMIDARRRYLWGPEHLKAEDYREVDARSVHFVASENGEFTGYAQYDPEHNRLRQMLVVPDARGNGLGRQLIKTVKAEARRSNREELLVHAWLESIEFYSRVGFRRAGPQVDEALVPWVPMRIPSPELDPPSPDAT